MFIQPHRGIFAALILVAAAAPAFSQAKVVISQIYGGGGNSGATFKNDFIELFNAGDTAQSLAGWSVQYASAAGTSWAATNLSGSIAPGKYYLVQESAGAGGTVNLPAPDATGGIAMSATSANVALVSSTTLLSGTCPSTNVVDKVAYGTGACFEGSAVAPLLTNTTADFRIGDGCQDSNDNARDFGPAAAPNPRNSASAANACVFAITDVSQFEGNSGTTAFNFLVKLNVAVGANVTFNASTVDGTATSSSDYTALSNAPFSITAGNTSTTVTVQVTGDLLSELSETFTVLLSNFSGPATPSFPTSPVNLFTATGTIQNDDPANGALTFSPSTAPNGTEGVAYSQTLTVNLGTGCSFSSTPLPPGLAVNASGTNTALLSGTPSFAGTFTFTVSALCNEGTNLQTYSNVTIAFACESGPKTSTAIHTVQGSGTVSPLLNQVVELEGIVVGTYLGTTTPDGFYLQEPDSTWDASPLTSEGIFVFDPGNTPPAVGSRVRVKGTVNEFGNQTELDLPTKLVCSTGNSFTRTVISLPVAAVGDLERYEGMAVQFNQQLVVVANFNVNAFDEVGLAPQVLFVPTQNPNQATWAPNTDLIARSTIFLDDASRVANTPGSTNLFPTLFPAGGLSANPLNDLRVGSRVNYNPQTLTLTPLQGVLDERNGAYRIETRDTVTFDNTSNPRPAAPNTGGRFKVVSANVLNFFTTLGSRGAQTATELNNQRTKIVAELAALNGDIVGLSEMQNFSDGQTGAANGTTHVYTNAAVNDLVNALNAVVGTGVYSFIDTLPLAASNGTDAIRSVLLYKSASVTPVGSPGIWNQNDTNRPTVAQTFKPASGAKADQQTFTVVLNHFRSKGSACGAGDDSQFQGNCNGTRLLMATNVATWLGGNPTADPAGPNRKVLLIGDFNAYFGEDPIQYFASHGYTNMINLLLGPNAYSYNFGLQNGYLDHVMANAAINPLIKNVAEWHINADEPAPFQALDTNQEPAAASYFAPDPFAASDHDPILIGLNPLAGDFNDNGSLDTTDQAMIQAAVGKPITDRRMDLDGDGQISVNDYRLWVNLYRAFNQ